MKTHKFIVTVKTTENRSAARGSLLCAFACRNPDGCEFFVRDGRPTITSKDLEKKIRAGTISLGDIDMFLGRIAEAVAASGNGAKP
jgi:hypothetical protein